MLVILFLVRVLALVLAATTAGGDRPRAPDGRRGGPIAVGEPADEDRDQVAQLQREAAERRQRELETQQEAAEPAGVPPGEAERQAVDALRQQSAGVRAQAARSLRRPTVPVGVIYDEERDAVADLLDDAEHRRLTEIDQRGIIDPALEVGTAGFPAELPFLPGHELYGVFDCPHCGNQVERAFPGSIDWDLASRDLVCPQCGGVVLRGGAASAETPPEPPAAEGVQTSAQSPPGATEAIETGEPGTSSGPGAQPLTADERAELEQLRAERAARPQEQQPPPSG